VAQVEGHIESIQQLEVLLLVARPPRSDWSARDVADELRTSLISVQHQLDKLVAAGLLNALPGSPAPHYSFIDSPPFGDAVPKLDALYPQFRVRINQLIYRRQQPP
jgi:hypothetical protein